MTHVQLPPPGAGARKLLQVPLFVDLTCSFRAGAGGAVRVVRDCRYRSPLKALMPTKMYNHAGTTRTASTASVRAVSPSASRLAAQVEQRAATEAICNPV